MSTETTARGAAVDVEMSSPDDLALADRMKDGRDKIIVELKTQPRLSGVEEAQIINYLKITKKRVGLLLNFGALPKLEWHRYVI